MSRKYYKVELFSLENEQDKKFKSSEMLYIVMNARIKKREEIIVYKTFNGNFKELLTNKSIPALTEELLPYSKSAHSYHLTHLEPTFFCCNTSVEKDLNNNFPILDNLEATLDDIESYLGNYIDKNDSKKSLENIMKKQEELDEIFNISNHNFNEILKQNNLIDNKVKRKERKAIKNMIKEYKI